MSKSKREKKISKVMGEFKEGTLKSGGSGKKVTNPKQAIAIALSEANAMNQGGMMYNEIMNRPMFQTPQMRQGSGIMAGVAPIRGYAEGDLVSDDFFTLEKTEEGSGMNLRDVTDFFFDPEDPVDYATIGLMAFPPAYVAARLARMGIKGKKAAEQVQKVVRAQEAIPEKLGGGTSRASTGLQVQLGALPVEEAIKSSGISETMPAEKAKSNPEKPSRMPQGIEQILKQSDLQSMLNAQQPRNMSIGGLLKIGSELGSKGLDLARNLLSRARKGEDVTDEASKAVSDGLIDVKDGDEVIKTIGDVADQKRSFDKTRQVGSGIATIVRNPGKSALGATAAGGIYALAQEYFPDLEIKEAIDALYERFPEAVKDIISPDVGERAELTESAKARLADVEKARREGFPEEPQITPPPPDPTFLDMLKGAGTQFKDFLQDPANQYALARASQPREGIAPMNFASDFAVAKEEYKQLEAQREEDTALMRNYRFLKETTDLSDREIISRLSGEPTARDEFMSLFSEALDTGGGVTPEQIAQFEAATGYTLPEEARVRLGVAAPPSAVID